MLFWVCLFSFLNNVSRNTNNYLRHWKLLPVVPVSLYFSPTWSYTRGIQYHGGRYTVSWEEIYCISEGWKLYQRRMKALSAKDERRMSERWAKDERRINYFWHRLISSPLVYCHLLSGSIRLSASAFPIFFKSYQLPGDRNKFIRIRLLIFFYSSI